MPTEILPRPEIVRSLYEQYYVSNEPIEGASSHWRQYAGQFTVEVDETGVIRNLARRGVRQCTVVGSDRFFDRATVFTHLVAQRERQRTWQAWREMKRVCGTMGADPTFDAFRQACSLGLIRRYLPPIEKCRVLIIGDGHELLAALVKQVWPNAQVTLVDLGRTLLFQTVNLQRAFPRAHHVLAGTDSFRADMDFLYCAADHLSALEPATFDLAVNIASMEEMTPETVGRYFTFLRRHMAPVHLFYCCNRERKVLPGGEVRRSPSTPGNGPIVTWSMNRAPGIGISSLRLWAATVRAWGL
jgi:putative sugar O-methyltransferase